MMNERIKELAVQAGLITDQDDRENWQEYINDVTKFAELLIRECDKYVSERWDVCEPWMYPGDLLKHFGVEEQTVSQKMAAAGYTRRPRGWTKEGTE